MCFLTCPTQPSECLVHCVNILVMCRVAVLDGGYPAWKAQGLPIDSSPVSNADVEGPAQAARNPPASTSYTAKLQVCVGPLCAAWKSLHIFFGWKLTYGMLFLSACPSSHQPCNKQLICRLADFPIRATACLCDCMFFVVVKAAVSINWHKYSCLQCL